jgi:hypothetical protein
MAGIFCMKSLNSVKKTSTGRVFNTVCLVNMNKFSIAELSAL